MKSPAFLFLSKDWLVDTAELSDSAARILIDLMAYNHVNGNLPSDLTKLAKLVRKDFDEFVLHWKEIESKFDKNEGRLVNRKLSKVISQYEKKSRKNKLIGTFAYVTKTLNLSKAELKILKERFNVDELLESDKEWDTKSLTEWCKNGVPFIVKGKEKVKEEADEFVSSEFLSVWNDWIDYKKSRNENYKSPKSKEAAYNKLVRLSDSDNEIAEKIVLQSKENDWAGLFAPKIDNNGFKTGQKIIKEDGKKRNY